MSRILMIGAGGVATVAAFKMAQNTDVFSELMIASHHKVYIRTHLVYLGSCFYEVLRAFLEGYAS